MSGEADEVTAGIGTADTAHSPDPAHDAAAGGYPGTRLSAARQAAGLEAEDVAGELRLDLKLVKALEAGDFAHLPEPVFIAGYLRSYARLLGLPADQIVAQYVNTETRDMSRSEGNSLRSLPKRQRQVANALPNSFSLSSAQPNKAPASRQPLLMVAMVVTVIAALGWAASLWLKPSSISSSVVPMQNGEAAKPDPQISAQALPIEPPIKPEVALSDSWSESADKRAAATAENVAAGKPAGAATSTAITATSSRSAQSRPGSTVSDSGVDTDAVIKKSLSLKPPAGAAAPEENLEIVAAAAPQIDVTSLSLRFSDTSWVDIRDATGKRLMRELGLKGATKKIEGVAPFKVLIGYGPAVEIAYNGQPFDFSAFQDGRIARFTLHVSEQTLTAQPDLALVPLPDAMDKTAD